ncbi:dynamin family protein [Nocardiopsis valliformis]|uniref:dynamin family protein n=1 Tax=Nocardiopsis valliformis TaxID=239974 RepID=UPI000347D0A6|nr:dynamin family protein [Nocardiopsis valliformis]
MTQNARGISGYEAFAQMRGELLDMADTLGRSAGELDQDTLSTAVTELRDRISRDSFSVIIMGEFNSGKTTTVNALLGEKVLPVSGKPTTAVLTVVKWGQERRATLYPLEPGDRPEEGKPVDPDELHHHITIDAGATAPRTWGRAEVEWPLDLCRNNVEIIDSPGLNEDEARSRITLEHTTSADAVVFVVSALQGLSQSEREVIDHNLCMFEHDNLYLLVNRINQVEDEVEEVRADLLARAKEYWGLDEDRVLFIDSRSALLGRSADDPDRVVASGLVEFEHSLERFLTEQKSRIKIVVPASEIGDLASAARENIDDLYVLMDKDLAELTGEYERQQGPLDRLWEERNTIDRIIGNHLEATRQQVSESAERMLLSAADSCVSWARGVPTRTGSTWRCGGPGGTPRPSARRSTTHCPTASWNTPTLGVRAN